MKQFTSPENNEQRRLESKAALLRRIEIAVMFGDDVTLGRLLADPRNLLDIRQIKVLLPKTKWEQAA